MVYVVYNQHFHVKFYIAEQFDTLLKSFSLNNFEMEAAVFQIKRNNF